VSITKQRVRLDVGPCRGEHVTLDVGGRHWESVAFEDADPWRVLDAVAALRWSVADNTSYPAALKRITGVTTPDAAPTRQETV
jgi:hypothetical protein